MTCKTILTALLILFAAGASLQADDGERKDGALLWVEKCMSCHFPGGYLTSDPDDGAVASLIEDIEYAMFNPQSGMDILGSMKFDELDRIARFLTFGSHGEEWMRGEHGRQTELYGSGDCLKCHDNTRLYNEPPVSCNQCHS